MVQWCVLNEEVTANTTTATNDSNALESRELQIQHCLGLYRQALQTEHTTATANANHQLPNDVLMQYRYIIEQPVVKECLEGGWGGVDRRSAGVGVSTVESVAYCVCCRLAHLTTGQESIDFYLKALGVDPGDAAVWMKLGKRYLDGGQVSKAALAFERSVGLELDRSVPIPGSLLSSLRALNECHFLLGNFEVCKVLMGCGVVEGLDRDCSFTKVAKYIHCLDSGQVDSPEFLVLDGIRRAKLGLDVMMEPSASKSPEFSAITLGHSWAAVGFALIEYIHNVAFDETKFIQLFVIEEDPLMQSRPDSVASASTVPVNDGSNEENDELVPRSTRRGQITKEKSKNWTGSLLDDLIDTETIEKVQVWVPDAAKSVKLFDTQSTNNSASRDSSEIKSFLGVLRQAIFCYGSAQKSVQDITETTVDSLEAEWIQKLANNAESDRLLGNSTGLDVFISSVNQTKSTVFDVVEKFIFEYASGAMNMNDYSLRPIVAELLRWIIITTRYRDSSRMIEVLLNHCCQLTLSATECTLRLADSIHGSLRLCSGFVAQQFKQLLSSFLAMYRYEVTVLNLSSVDSDANEVLYHWFVGLLLDSRSSERLNALNQCLEKIQQLSHLTPETESMKKELQFELQELQDEILAQKLEDCLRSEKWSIAIELVSDYNNVLSHCSLTRRIDCLKILQKAFISLERFSEALTISMPLLDLSFKQIFSAQGSISCEEDNWKTSDRIFVYSAQVVDAVIDALSVAKMMTKEPLVGEISKLSEPICSQLSENIWILFQIVLDLSWRSFEIRRLIGELEASGDEDRCSHLKNVYEAIPHSFVLFAQFLEYWKKEEQSTSDSESPLVQFLVIIHEIVGNQELCKSGEFAFLDFGINYLQQLLLHSNHSLEFLQDLFEIFAEFVYCRYHIKVSTKANKRILDHKGPCDEKFTLEPRSADSLYLFLLECENRKISPVSPDAFRCFSEVWDDLLDNVLEFDPVMVGNKQLMEHYMNAPFNPYIELQPAVWKQDLICLTGPDGKLTIGEEAKTKVKIPKCFKSFFLRLGAFYQDLHYSCCNDQSRLKSSNEAAESAIDAYCAHVYLYPESVEAWRGLAYTYLSLQYQIMNFRGLESNFGDIIEDQKRSLRCFRKLLWFPETNKKLAVNDYFQLGNLVYIMASRPMTCGIALEHIERLNYGNLISMVGNEKLLRTQSEITDVADSSMPVKAFFVDIDKLEVLRSNSKFFDASSKFDSWIPLFAENSYSAGKSVPESVRNSFFAFAGRCFTMCRKLHGFECGAFILATARCLRKISRNEEDVLKILFRAANVCIDEYQNRNQAEEFSKNPLDINYDPEYRLYRALISYCSYAARLFVSELSTMVHEHLAVLVEKLNVQTKIDEHDEWVELVPAERYPTILSLISLLKWIHSKFSGEHRAQYRLAWLWYKLFQVEANPMTSKKLLEFSQVELSNLSSNIFTTALERFIALNYDNAYLVDIRARYLFSFWKQDSEMPGKFFVYTHQTADLLLRVTIDTKDSETLWQLLRKFCSSAASDVLWMNEMTTRGFFALTSMIRNSVQQLISEDHWFLLGNDMPKKAFNKILPSIERSIFDQAKIEENNVLDDITHTPALSIFRGQVISCNSLIPILKRTQDLRFLKISEGSAIEPMEFENVASARECLADIAIQIYSYIIAVRGIGMSLVAPLLLEQHPNFEAIDRFHAEIGLWFLKKASNQLAVNTTKLEAKLSHIILVASLSQGGSSQSSTTEPVSSTQLGSKIISFCKNLRNRHGKGTDNLQTEETNMAEDGDEPNDNNMDIRCDVQDDSI